MEDEHSANDNWIPNGEEECTPLHYNALQLSLETIDYRHNPKAYKLHRILLTL